MPVFCIRIIYLHNGPTLKYSADCSALATGFRILQIRTRKLIAAFKLRKLVLAYSLNRTFACTCTAGNALVSVDLVLAVALGYRFVGASILTRTAGNALITYFVCHCRTPPYAFLHYHSNINNLFCNSNFKVLSAFSSFFRIFYEKTKKSLSEINRKFLSFRFFKKAIRRFCRHRLKPLMYRPFLPAVWTK